MKTTRPSVSKLKAAQRWRKAATTGTSSAAHCRGGENPAMVPISSAARLFSHWMAAAQYASSVLVLIWGSPASFHMNLCPEKSSQLQQGRCRGPERTVQCKHRVRGEERRGEGEGMEGGKESNLIWGGALNIPRQSGPNWTKQITAALLVWD